MRFRKRRSAVAAFAGAALLSSPVFLDNGNGKPGLKGIRPWGIGRVTRIQRPGVPIVMHIDLTKPS
jgi:hypothetical protein